MVLHFVDRADAGRRLSERLLREQLPGLLVVLALPRGGVPVAAQVARALGAPMDLLFVRKIAAPWQRERAVGTVVDGEAPSLEIDEATCAAAGGDPACIDREAAAAWRESAHWRQLLLRGRAALELAGKTTILVDDGIASGTTARAALGALRRRQGVRTVPAVLAAAHETLMQLRLLCDRIVCLAEPQPLRALRQHYVDFRPVGDAEVVAAMDAVQPPDPKS